MSAQRTWADHVVSAAKTLHVAALVATAGFVFWWIARVVYLFRQTPRNGDAVDMHFVWLLLGTVVLFGLVGLTRELSRGSMRRRRAVRAPAGDEKRHTFLVAFDVTDLTGTQHRSEVEETLYTWLPVPDRDDTGTTELDHWWVAEDDRQDESTEDSAIFVPKGMQRHVGMLLDSKGFGQWSHRS